MAKAITGETAADIGTQAAALRAIINGTRGNDRLEGTDGADTINGLAGNDRLEGEDGDDVLNGGAGDDRLEADDGNDRLDGGAGDDSLEADSGRDRLVGGNGGDRLDGGDDADILTGGRGADTFIFDEGDGRDRISDFGRVDFIRFDISDDIDDENAPREFDDLRITQADGATRIAYGNDGVILLEGVTVNQVSEAQFIFT